MKKLLILLLALLAIAAIAYLCIYKTSVPAIQADIENRAKNALAAEGIQGVNVNVDGRDIILTGDVVSQEAREKLDGIARVRGYNLLDNKVTVNGSSNANFAIKAPQSHSLTVTLNEDGVLILDGIMDADSHQQLKAAAIARYGESKVTDRILELDMPVAQGMPDVAVNTIEKISGLSTGKFTLNGDKLRVEGTSPSRIMLEQVGKQVAAVPEGYTLDLELEVARNADNANGSEGIAANDNEAKNGKQPVASLPQGGKVVKASKAEIRKCQREFNRILKTRILFASSSDKIQKASYPILNNLARTAKRCSNMAIKIHGHTDSTGRNSVNKSLSQKRAKAVLNYLVKQGVPASLLTAEGHGASKPVASNQTRQGRARNRRIELTVESIK